MTRRLWFLFVLLAALTFCQSSEAQPIPTWKNDAQGRPAPPCMVLDSATGLSTPCSASNPLPTGGGGTGSGTTSGTSTTGFGKQWFPGTIKDSGAGGTGMVAFFDTDLNVVYLRRNTACGNCLQVAISTDGGVTGTFFSTSAIIGNSVAFAHRVPASTPRYLVSNVGGPLVILQSTSLSSGWTAITGLPAVGNVRWASNATGSTVLSFNDNGASTAATVCRSTDAGISFSGCADWGTQQVASTQQIAFAGGTTWLFDNQNGEIFRSTNDGVSFALVTTLGGNGRSLRCLSPGFTVCLYTASDGNVYRSTDSGATWPSIVLSGLGTSSGLCDFNSGNAGAGLGAPPVGLTTISQNVFSTFNSGVAWFPGQTNGFDWDGVGTMGLASLDCRAGRGVATYTGTGGVRSIFNPLTSPGGTLQSGAGGYSVVAPIQAGIILNALPTTSAAATAAVVTLTNSPGSRVCIRTIALISSAASVVVTLTVTDGAVVVLNLGTPATGIIPILFTGTPLLCSQTGNNLLVNVGSAGGAITTTTSVIADRYPN